VFFSDGDHLFHRDRDVGGTGARVSSSVGVGGGGRVAVSARCHGRESCNCLCSLSMWQYTDADIVLSVIGDRVDGLG
jgi:hypothetical protein